MRLCWLDILYIAIIIIPKDYYLPYHHILSTGKDDNSSSRKQKKNGHSFQYILADTTLIFVYFLLFLCKWINIASG